ncbi:hypothetical protein AM493_20355 [Flavobacterium akiainvivens]|uniref:Uncharacterized protein n=1 Tax=Flavobacterium akiainvivens TaxID=1202724 RepID=A0A0M8MLB2_9FLAO|nr:hypothetical protein [Flavobacterium akiainvivens]KOS08137.1 hypothetical protein AM493_20355 [Flavobacterium akiainvivens]SFQ72233.1 hypothetical protein SAMN05444144_11779 [Flavobacterium akiainvivens]
MKRLLTFALLFVLPVSAMAQPEKDALLKRDHDSIQEVVKLMYYLDQKAMHLITMEVADKQRIDADFKAFYNDSIVAGNPTKLDIGDYIGYRNGKHPKNAEKFLGKVFDKNAQGLLELSQIYGYLSTSRIKFKVEPNKLLNPIQFAIRTNEYDYKLNKVFDKELKKGNMPERDFAFFLTVKKGEISDSDIDALENLGMKMNKKE